MGLGISAPAAACAPGAPLVVAASALAGPGGPSDDAGARRRCEAFSRVPFAVWAEELGPLLQICDLAVLLATSREAADAVAAFVRVAAVEWHGVSSDEVASFRELLALDTVPGHVWVDFAAPDFIIEARRVKGSHLVYPIFVGGEQNKPTTAMSPPAKGDIFEVSLEMRRGKHAVLISGWRNPYHGVLSLSLDGQRITGDEGLDWYSRSTSSYAFPEFEVTVDRTGVHTFSFEVIGSRHPQGYWMCLDQLQAWCLDDGRYDTPAGSEASFLTRWRRRLRPASPSGSPSSSSAEGWWRRSLSRLRCRRCPARGLDIGQ